MNSETRITLSNALDELNKQIPTGACPNGCCKCCGPVPMSRIEADRIGIDRLYTRGKGLYGDTCEFVDDETGKCRIYPIRPFVCRFFNTPYAGVFKCNETPESGRVHPNHAEKLLDAYFEIICNQGCVDEFIAANNKTFNPMKRREKRNGWGSRFFGIKKGD
jgi:Fe-S-cluster containining protein